MVVEEEEEQQLAHWAGAIFNFFRVSRASLFLFERHTRKTPLNDAARSEEDNVSPLLW